MARFFMYLFAATGSLAVFNWVLANAIFGDDLRGPAARFAANPDMLILGLILMAVGLGLALFPVLMKGKANDVEPGSELVIGNKRG